VSKYSSKSIFEDLQFEARTLPAQSDKENRIKANKY
jgi:hypothetical protein